MFGQIGDGESDSKLCSSQRHRHLWILVVIIMVKRAEVSELLPTITIRFLSVGPSMLSRAVMLHTSCQKLPLAILKLLEFNSYSILTAKRCECQNLQS